jgi:hypothetical protein
MKNKLYFVFSFMFLSTALMSCLKEKAEPVDGDCYGLVVDYNDHIEPLIRQSCATNLGPGTGCHDAWIFEYDNLAARIVSQEFQETVFNLKTMPKPVNDFGIAPLTTEEIRIFKCWIDAGFPE